MKYLKKSEINLVRPKFREMVKNALDKGEKVPYGVIYLSDKEIFDKDTKWTRTVVGEWKIED